MVKILVNSQNKAYLTSQHKALLANPNTERFNATLNSFFGEVDSDGTLGTQAQVTNLDFTGVKDFGQNALIYLFWGKKIGTVNFGGLEEMSGASCCQQAFSSSTVSGDLVFPDLKTISGNQAGMHMFSSCPNITSVSFPKLTTISSTQCFNNGFSSSGITAISFPALETITSTATYAFIQAFGGYKGTTASFPMLSTISANYVFRQAFYNSTKIENIYFNSLKSNGIPNSATFNNMLQGITSTCTVHFPSNLQSIMSSWADVTAKFGSNNATILFDLPATN